MPNPNRERPFHIIGSGFCRKEVQSVLRRFHRGDPAKGEKAISAHQILRIFWLLQTLKHTDPKWLKDIESKLVAPHHKKSSLLIAYFIFRHPSLVGALLTALVKSKKRILTLHKFTPERIVEDCFPELIDLEKNVKLSQALPNLTEAQIAQVRTRISSSRTCVEYWQGELFKEYGVDSETILKDSDQAWMRSIMALLWAYKIQPKS
jgi:hypothetical protein